VDPVTGQHDLDKLRLNWTRSVGVHDDGDPATPIRGDERPDPDGTQRPPSGPADWWDKTGRYYAPSGARIVLHGESPCPYIEMFRYDDPDGDGLYWRDPDGEPTDAYTYSPLVGMCNPMADLSPIGIEGNRARVPFPPNGVIYAEGNILMSGTMPPVRDYRGRVGAMIPPDEVPEGYFGQRLTDQGRSRRFDLQVVSGGTIYIEDDLLTPRGALLIPDSLEADQLYGSRLALLARDCVCVNTTALNPRPLSLFEPVLVTEGEGEEAEEKIYHYNDAQPLYPEADPRNYWLFQGPVGDENWDVPGYVVETEPAGIELEYKNVRFQSATLREQLADVRLILGHSGWFVPGGDGLAQTEPPGRVTGDNDAATDVAVSFANDAGTTTWPWDYGSGRYTFRTLAEANPSGADDSNHWCNTDVDEIELLPNDYQLAQVHQAGLPATYLTGDDYITFESRVWPIEERDGENKPIGWQVAPDELGYVMGPVAIAPPRDEGPLPVRIEALIYAQNGSWFVIPGRWFNEDPDDLAVDPTAWEAPGYHEPLNMKISVYGAVSENLPADLGSAANWTSKWAGPIGRGGEGFLSYAYDPLLRAPRRETVGRIGYLRFPRFPVTSDLVIWGERVSGAPES